MEETVFSYKCPSCDAALTFDGKSDTMTCEYCGSHFDVATVKKYNDRPAEGEAKAEEDTAYEHTDWSDEERETLGALTCPTCGGELICDETTAATSCPYCGNPTMVKSNLSGAFRPDVVLPFDKTKEEAKAALIKFASHRPLLPRDFLNENHLEEIKGIYLPFWLYSCRADASATFGATRVFTTTTKNERIVRTDYYECNRAGDMAFEHLPVDGASKIDDALMDSIEPFDFSAVKPFDAAYLSGFFADKYDEDAKTCAPRARERIKNTAQSMLRDTVSGFATVTPKTASVSLSDTAIRYALLPVWLLVTKYDGKSYTYAMNGQTGKFVGELPVSRRRFWGFLLGIGAAISALALLGYLFLGA